MTKTQLPIKIKTNPMLTGLLTGAALLVGAACGTSAESASPSATPVEVAPVANAEPVPEEIPVSAPTIDDAETSSTNPVATDAPLDIEPPPASELVVEDEAAAAPETAPAPVVEDAPDLADNPDNACGPTRAIPTTATDVSTVGIDFGGQGNISLATSYQDDGQWYLRYDDPFLSNEMVLDSPIEGTIEVLKGIQLGDFANQDLLVQTSSVGDVNTFGIFGNHDGCLFRYGGEDPIELFVGSKPGAKYGLECHTDEYGSFIIASSATDNGDGTWNVYGTYFTQDDETHLEAGDGGHDFAIPSDHAMFASFENWKC